MGEPNAERNEKLDHKKKEVEPKKPFFTTTRVLSGGYGLLGLGLLGCIVTFFIDSVLIAQIALTLLGLGTIAMCIAMIMELNGYEPLTC
jgi:hypothetical protein